ncbi:hypothetical protein [Nonomuraea sp. C10]|uniref:hypothetical protein n=1 Tax=Nonomuraea sp. C10 TaxID=2600577 RepID=UPI0011CD4EC4|nr:hypothetical protein [Nonomuraea sp. C10]TXK42377.1 hypothetical protein FR742_24895 [Nonomuraea sp. C10]
MASPELTSLCQAVSDLRQDLIAEGKHYSAYTRQDHTMALSFILLSSAAIEHFVEERCRSAAAQGLRRLKRGQPTRSGHAIVIWYTLRKMTGTVPLSRAEIIRDHDYLERVEEAYGQLSRKSHGIDSGDLQKLLIPLGLKETDIDQELLDRLDDLSDARNRASHIKVNRARLMTEPMREWERIDPILTLLDPLDQAIDIATLKD